MTAKEFDEDGLARKTRKRELFAILIDRAEFAQRLTDLDRIVGRLLGTGEDQRAEEGSRKSYG